MLLDSFGLAVGSVEDCYITEAAVSFFFFCVGGFMGLEHVYSAYLSDNFSG